MSTWVCSSCGTDQAKANPARPSVDDRYAVGYCDRCCPLPVQDPDDPTKTRPANRKTVPLVRSDVWDPTILAANRERARVHRLFNGKATLSKADDEERAELRRKWEAEAAERRAGL